MHTKRNTLICQLYADGISQPEIASIARLTKARVGQILQEAKVQRAGKPLRTAFTGVYLTPDMKEAIRVEASHESKSISAFIAELVENELKRRNISWASAPTDADRPLPFESE